METIEIKGSSKQIIASEAMLEDSTFFMVCLNRIKMNNVALIDAKITNADLSNLEIEGAQLGGAYFHNIGMPPEGHPCYKPEVRQRPIKFENCDLRDSAINDCDLRNLSISNCNTIGMAINGILIDDLLKAYQGSL